MTKRPKKLKLRHFPCFLGKLTMSIRPRREVRFFNFLRRLLIIFGHSRALNVISNFLRSHQCQLRRLNCGIKVCRRRFEYFRTSTLDQQRSNINEGRKVSIIISSNISARGNAGAVVKSYTPKKSLGRLKCIARKKIC